MRSSAWPKKSALCSLLAAVALVSILLRISRDGTLLRSKLPRASTQHCLAHSKRARPGALLGAPQCVNASTLDAGVCVELGGANAPHVRCVPSLAVIGAMKSGTTNVMLYLSLHPSLRTSERWGWPVESRFFSRATSASAAENWRAYVEHYPLFTSGGRAGLVFDKSPNYMVNPVVPRVLHRLAPSLKLLVMLRDPVKRAYSHFQHECRNGRVRETARGRVYRASCAGASAERCAESAQLPYPCSAEQFDRMVRSELALSERQYRLNNATLPAASASVARAESEDWRCAWSFKDGEGDSNVLPRGFYACQLRRWLALFPREQLKALVFEEFVASRADTLRAVADVETFLNVHHFDYGASWRVALTERLYALLPSRAGYAPMQPDTAALLRDLYCAPNAALARLLHRALPWPCGDLP